MADDLTDALRAIIEPIKDTLISAAQAHYLASIRQEAADMVRHGERVLELIGNLVPEDMEPHWGIRPEYQKVYERPQRDPEEYTSETLREWAERMAASAEGPPQPETITRDTPQVGELWMFASYGWFPESYIAAEILMPEPGQPVEGARIAKGKLSGSEFKSNSSKDPRPIQLLQHSDETDTSGHWKS